MAKKNRKILLIILAIILLITGSYTIYSLTLINPDNTQSIIRHLTTDKDNPPEILALDRLDNYVCIIYLDKSFDNISYSRVVLEKSPIHLNRYKIVATGHNSHWGEEYGLYIQNTPHNVKIKDKEKIYFYVFGFADKETPYKVIYTDENEKQETIYSSKAQSANGSYIELFSIEVDSAISKNYDLPNIELIL